MRPAMNSPISKSLVTKALLWLGDSALWFCVLAGFAWAFGAIWFYALLPELVRKPLAVVYLAFGIWLIRRGFRFRKETLVARADSRSWTKWARPALAVTVPIVYLATLLVQPSTDRQMGG